MHILFLLFCLVVPLGIGFVAFLSFRHAHYKYIKLKRSRGGAKRLRKYRYIVPAVFIGILSVPILLYILNFYNSTLAKTASEWGQFGDYFGGLLNPIFGFSSLLALLYTIRIQSQELRLTRLEFEKSVKTQQKMVDEQYNNRKQSLLIQDYLYVSATVRNLCRELNSLLSKSLELEQPPEQWVSLLPNGLGSILSMTRSLKKSSSKHAEYAFLQYPLAMKLNIESSLGSSQNQSKFNTACTEYCLLAHDLFSHAQMLSDLCRKLTVDVENEHTQRNDFKIMTRHLFYAYLFCKIAEVSGFVSDIFIPEFDAVMMKFFEQNEFAYGLKSLEQSDELR